MAFFSTTNILSLPSSVLIYPRFLPFHHHCNPPLRLSLPHKLTFNLSYKNLKTIVSAVTSSYPTLSNRFRVDCDRPAGYLNTPLTVVAAVLSKWFDIYSGVLMVRDRQPLSAIRDLFDPYLNLFRNIIPPVFDMFVVSPLLSFAVLGTLGSILNNRRCLLADGSYEVLILYGNL
ncbi:hypothetical protein N665_0491s0003 [Sinapis alba]|nr:hypothetical protein N665_0491s0003 [Sinapis alba]